MSGGEGCSEEVMEVVCGGAMAVGIGRDKAWKEMGRVRGA